MTWGNCVWTFTWSASNFTTQWRIAIVRFNTAITIEASCIVLTLNTLSCLWVTCLSMSITITHFAVGEIPESDLALITFSTVCIWMTVTLARDQVTFVIFWSNAVTIASFTSIWPKTISSWSTSITLAPNYVLFATTSSSKLFAFFTLWTSWVTVASWKIINCRFQASLLFFANLHEAPLKTDILTIFKISLHLSSP